MFYKADVLHLLILTYFIQVLYKTFRPNSEYNQLILKQNFKFVTLLDL
jgi:hypothetical protein